jgi:hypothetical protein
MLPSGIAPRNSSRATQVMAQDRVPMRTGHHRGTFLWRVTAAASIGALVAGCGLIPSPGPGRDAQGTVTARAGTDAFSIEVGDCIDDPGVQGVSDITVLPCHELHDFEAFASTRLPDGEYPGVTASDAAASDFCAKEFTAFVDFAYDDSALELLYFYPLEQSWDAEDDREILCFVSDADGTPVTGTLRDAGR